MKRNIKVSLALFCTWMVAGVPLGSMAAGVPVPPSRLTISDSPVSPPAPTTPPGNDGLLSGMTPATLRVPSGWSLGIKQDFELGLTDSENTHAKVASTKSHTGSKSLWGSYTGDAAEVSWWLRSGKIGNFSEVYVSWYDFTESQARFNDEYWVSQFVKRGPSGELYQEIIVDWMWVPNFNSTKSYLYFVPQSAAGEGKTARYAGGEFTVPVGNWVQWEIHYRPNTPGNSDGFIRIYKDGNLFQSAENKNLNGLVNMSDMSIKVGGIYTKLTWLLEDGSCGSSFGSGMDDGPRVTDFNKCPCPNQCPADGKVPIFSRYYDDIVILRK